MYPDISADAVACAFQMLCYFFTAIVALVSCVIMRF